MEEIIKTPLWNREREREREREKMPLVIVK